VRIRNAIILTAALAGATLSACSSSGSDGADATTTEPAAEEAAPLTILVGNDDGYQAEGIDVLVEALRKVDGVTLEVVAPKEQQSGTGGKVTEGDPPAVEEVELASGFEAHAVDGYPSDAMNAAFDELDIDPDLVITGINEGQNLGPAVDLSGTVGAARVAIARGVPALATSQGAGTPYDYEAAVPLILDWLEEHRADLAAGTAEVELTNLNVPSCDTGEVRGLAEVEPQLGGDVMASLSAADCSSTTPLAELDDDVEAFMAGYATIDVIPSEAGG
jgi:5'-nucleotidase